jgi:hypothetical protein
MFSADNQKDGCSANSCLRVGLPILLHIDRWERACRTLNGELTRLGELNSIWIRVVSSASSLEIAKVAPLMVKAAKDRITILEPRQVFKHHLIIH